MYGWQGTILRVDLSRGLISKEPLRKEMGKNYIGGRGINSRILYDEVKPGVDALDPSNRLIFGTGPLTGTGLLPDGRWTVTAKSPMTGIHGDANGGGHFAAELKWAGYDHIIFQGKADKPVYLWINDEHVELRDAAHLWGKTTWETDKIIKEEIGDPGVQIACIGPGGENLVRFACVVSNLGRAAGRTGMGAVMGSKNLKAIAVRGSKPVKVANAQAYREVTQRILQRELKNPYYPVLSTYGTPDITLPANEYGMLGVRNGRQTGGFEGIEEVRHETLKEKYWTRSRACFGCPIHCAHWFKIKEGAYAGERGEGLEYGTVGAFGPLCGNSYAPSLFKCHNLCNQYGLDTINCGEMIAIGMDWYDLGLITKEDTGGIALKFGNHEAIVEMVHQIAKKEGFGAVLAEGPVRAAKIVGKGAERCISHAKGWQYSIDDARAFRGFELNNATSTRGADHLRGLPFTDWAGLSPKECKERFGTEKVGVPSSYEGKAKAVHYYRQICTLADALEICKFYTEWVGHEVNVKDMAELFSAATGIEKDEEGMKEAADRIYTVERAFLIREGITRKDDAIAGRQRNEPKPTGPYKGVAHDEKKWNKMLDEYYDLVGWDKESGAPTRAKLEALGLKDIADELERR